MELRLKSVILIFRELISEVKELVQELNSTACFCVNRDLLLLLLNCEVASLMVGSSNFDVAWRDLDSKEGLRHERARQEACGNLSVASEQVLNSRSSELRVEGDEGDWTGSAGIDQGVLEAWQAFELSLGLDSLEQSRHLVLCKVLGSVVPELFLIWAQGLMLAGAVRSSALSQVDIVAFLVHLDWGRQLSHVSDGEPGVRVLGEAMSEDDRAQAIIDKVIVILVASDPEHGLDVAILCGELDGLPGEVSANVEHLGEPWELGAVILADSFVDQ